MAGDFHPWRWRNRKTSIALKVAYDILDNHPDKFDAIVWVTAKSSTLSTHEVQRINGAILDSVGLFAEAARQLGGEGSSDPVSELLDYLETFRVLLILDNMETVMDQRLRDFLQELPLGSKVLITSRIGFQMENPVKLDPLTETESRQLLLTLAHGRNVPVIKNLDPDGLTKLVGKLKGHPLYIKWLIAGVQAGRRPSEIVANDETLLDFCMSNVYERLSQDSQQVLQSMQVLRGSRMQAELAYLNDYAARQIQSVLLELLATNFVSMTRSGADNLESSYAIGDFAAAYLARKRPTKSRDRELFLDRSQKLGELGARLTGETKLNRYAARTLDVRGSQDVPVARILREALKAADNGQLDHAVSLCHEAQSLAPTYHEAWRCEGFIQSLRRDHSSAIVAYEHAVEDAEGTPSSSLANYHFATYLRDETGDFRRALELLQQGARDDPAPEILFGIAQSHFGLQNHEEALDTCHGLASRSLSLMQRNDTALLGLRAASYGLIKELWDGEVGAAIALAETAAEFAYSVEVATYSPELLDWLIAVTHWARRASNDVQSDDYLSRRAADCVTRLEQRIRIIDPGGLPRVVALVKPVRAIGDFVFVDDDVDRFAHRNNFLMRSQWPQVRDNSVLVFDRAVGPKGPRAERIRLLE